MWDFIQYLISYTGNKTLKFSSVTTNLSIYATVSD